MFSISSSSNHPINFLDIKTPNKDWLDTYRIVNYGYVMMGNDDPCKVTRIKNVNIKMFNDVVRTLYDVRHIRKI